MKRLPKILFFGLFFIQGFFVLHYASSLPFMDEWEALVPNAFPKGFSWDWLWTQHNEHRILWTKLQSWFFYWVTGWDLRWQLAMNYFVLFGGILAIYFKILKKCSQLDEAWIYLSLCFLCSPLLHQNHFWAFQSQFHFMLLFLSLASYFLFTRNDRLGLFLGILSTVACVFSFSNGVIASGVLVVLWIGFGAQGRGVKVMGTAIFAAAILFWFVGFQRGAALHLYPWQGAYWPYFLNLVSLGFGVNGQSLVLSLLCFVLILFPSGLTLLQRPSELRKKEVGLEFTLVLSILAALAVIALGRGASGLGAKSSRYAEIAILLIPLTYMGYARIFADRPLLRKRVLVGISAFLFISFIDDWKFNKIYQTHYLGMEDGKKCLRDYFSDPTLSAFCPTLYPEPLNSRLSWGRDLKLKIWDELKATGANE